MTGDHDRRSRRPHAWLGNPWFLLAAIALQILLGPLTLQSDLPLAGGLTTLVLLAAVNTACAHRHDRGRGLVLGGAALALTWVDTAFPHVVLATASYVAVVALYVFVIHRLLAGLLRAVEVDARTIARAICSYLLLGAAWTQLYLPLANEQPDAFRGLATAGAGHAEMVTDLFYFSFVTLTTLGYGDIAPVSPLARSLATLEALTGTLFLAVLIALLMGKYAARDARS
jgi:hypothetical protein